MAFAEQIFYSAGNALYHYSMVTGKNTEIYKAGAGNTITDLQFRLPGNFNEEGDYNFRLGIAVLTGAGRGQLHELKFSQSADVTERVVFDGDFGPIRNIAYSILHRVIR